MNPLEVFSWAILSYEGFRPGSRAWRNRNPGNVRASRLAASKDAGGYCVFSSFADGWAALLVDVTAKTKGAPFTRTRLGPDSTILEFLKVWAPAADHNVPEKYAQFVAEFLAKTLKRTITVETKIGSLQGEPYVE